MGPAVREEDGEHRGAIGEAAGARNADPPVRGQRGEGGRRRAGVCSGETLLQAPDSGRGECEGSPTERAPAFGRGILLRSNLQVIVSD